MAEFTITEAQDQARKAGKYFARVLSEHGSGFLACEVDGTTLVVAVGDRGKRLQQAIEEEKLLGDATIQHDPGEVTVPRPVVLVPRYHRPTGEFAGREGHVHLHVLDDAKLGRRVRKSGECLCGKKRGSHEEPPEEHREMCGECVRVAEEHSLTFQLA